MYNLKVQIGQDYNMLVPWYLMTSYLYYKKDESIISDSDYDWMCKELMQRWEQITHWHKEFIDRDSLSAGSGYAITKYPTRVKGAAIAVLGNKPND